MKTQWSTKRLLLTILAFSGSLLALVEATTGIPNIFNANETPFQQQTHFLVFTGKDTAGETATTAKAYYAAIDPTNKKATFPEWLVNAGFISDVSQWRPTGKQLIACDLPGCDLPGGTYGDNIINTDSHAIVLNAADLGFVRNQFIRCVPSCTANNPIIYTYLENYPVNPFAASGSGGSGFPIKTGYPTQAEAAAAIESALTRPAGGLAGCNPSAADTALGCSIQRIADVAFEWAPPPTNPSSSTRYGQLYAYVLNDDLSETITLPASSGAIGKTTPNVATRALNPIHTGDPFPPNLDFLGFKQHPGVCFICHGGNPKNLTATGQYPQQGRIDGFRFLPLDVRNLLFTSDGGGELTSRFNQELQLKEYNLAVLKTVTAQLQNDEHGARRVPHLREVIAGWYTDPGGPLFGRTTQNADFIPAGWREPVDGGSAPAGSERLYTTVIGPSCRSCHFNRELSLDFGTAADFKAFRQDVLEYVLQPLCNAGKPQPGNRPMPLAHLTYQRFWQANNTPQTLPSGQPPLTLSNTADQVANYFGFTTAGYCATQ
ncbi:MAG TPA: hypothetical protein VHB50_04540 [Bryobacteraceae bacterium]|nr:hypothetical protein [Bryobacteraceae bacterium]